jgi:hypothetical protein
MFPHIYEEPILRHKVKKFESGVFEDYILTVVRGSNRSLKKITFMA